MMCFNPSKDTSKITQDGDMILELNSRDSLRFAQNFIKVDTVEEKKTL